MLKNYLKITFRNLMKNKVFVFINILGLGTALACCIVAFLNWEYNAKFDAYHVNTENTYRVNFTRITNGRPIKNGSCPLPLGTQIRTSVPQVEEVIRYLPLGGNFKVRDEVFRTWLAAVDPAFFETFTFPMRAGSGSSITDKNSILISSDLQEKYFPNQPNPVGQTLVYLNGDTQVAFQIGGVFERPPQNTSFFMEAFIQYDHMRNLLGLQEDDWSEFNTTFVTVNDASNVPEIENQLQNYVAIQNQAKRDYKVSEYYLDPFQGMAVRAEREDIWNHWLNQSMPTSAVIGPSIMAILLLLIACFNFTNTSIAIANRRIKEIGIRKVLGSNKRQLITQFLGENTLLVLMALLFGMLLSVFIVPAYSAMWPFLDIQLNFLKNWDLLGFLILLLVFTALIAGSYPAFYVSSFQPNVILRGKIKFSGTNSLTRILLTLQFAISLIAIISGFVFNQNAQYQEQYDMGFDRESTLFANVNNQQDYSKLRNELMSYNQIKEIAGSRHSISSSWYTDPIKHGEAELDVNIFDVGAGYLSTIGATLAEGRDFVEKSQTDKDNSVIINQELVRTMGWSDPLNKRIVLSDTLALNVIGVVKDIYFDGGLWDPLEPMMLRYVEPSDFRFLTVRADAEDLLAVKKLMDEKWKIVFPNELSSVNFMDEEMANSALVNSNIRVMFMVLGIIAVLLSVIGLFSLVSLNLIKRMKEIGVRKVLGASIEHITMQMSREFIIILSIASILGCISGYYLTDMLMGSIWTYYVPLKPWPFILSVLILFVASALTISGKVIRAASVNPADILKDE
jgi:putative ABC transport system permease protein